MQVTAIMEEDVTPSSSYLDLDDPFDTLGSSKKIKNSSSLEGSESGELSDESLDEKECSSTKIEPMEEDIEKAKDIFSVWCESIEEQDGDISRSLLDAPSLWSFSPSNCKLEDMFANDENNQVSPHLLKSLSDEILATDVSLMQTVPDNQLIELVSTTARLVQEHDRLITSRVKLLESMKEMQKVEKEATVKVMNSITQDQMNEHTRQIVAEMTAKLETLGDDENDEKENTQPSTPSLLGSSSSSKNLMHPYAVPPPDTARPPPLNHLVGSALPPLIPDVSRPPPAIPKRMGPENFNYPPPQPSFIRSPNILPVRISPPMGGMHYQRAQNRPPVPPPFTPMLPPPPFFAPPPFPGSPNMCGPPPLSQNFVNAPPAFMAPRKRVLGTVDERWAPADRAFYISNCGSSSSSSNSSNGRNGPSTPNRTGISGNSSPVSPPVMKEPCTKKERDL